MDKSDKVCGVLFDLDGVLMDTESIYSDFWNAVDERFPTGVPNFSSVIKGSNLHEILTQHYPDEATRLQVSEMLHRFQDNMQFNYFPGAMELVTSLSQADTPLAVVTSSDYRKMDQLYAQHPEFTSLFDAIVTGDMVTHAKPHPECFLKGAQAIGRDIRHCIVIEDSIKGLEAGMRAGAKVVGIATTNSLATIEHKCHLAVEAITDLTAEILLAL